MRLSVSFCARKNYISNKMALAAILKRLERKLDSLINSHSSLAAEIKEVTEKVNDIEHNLFEGVSDEEDDEEISETSTESDESESEDDGANALTPPGVSLNDLFPKETTDNNHVWNVRSHTDRKKLYSVELIDGKEWTCNCPAFVYRKNDNYKCKHIKQVERDEF